ncbi:MAG: hypothetical protein LBH46_01355 [Rickettsiales bacterium]|jgi:hypothetical protein|nr:hypothetical protein [Rickettsiales bacterium]
MTEVLVKKMIIDSDKLVYGDNLIKVVRGNKVFYSMKVLSESATQWANATFTINANTESNSTKLATYAFAASGNPVGMVEMFDFTAINKQLKDLVSGGNLWNNFEIVLTIARSGGTGDVGDRVFIEISTSDELSE